MGMDLAWMRLGRTYVAGRGGEVGRRRTGLCWILVSENSFLEAELEKQVGERGSVLVALELRLGPGQHCRVDVAFLT